MDEAAKAPDDGQDDDCSVTSTSDDNEDSEFFSYVRILTERQIGGTTMYLVEWENFPLSGNVGALRKFRPTGTSCRLGKVQKRKRTTYGPRFQDK